MSLTRCPGCNTQISANERVCPYCGAIRDYKRSTPVVVGLIALALLGVLLWGPVLKPDRTVTHIAAPLPAAELEKVETQVEILPSGDIQIGGSHGEAPADMMPASSTPTAPRK